MADPAELLVRTAEITAAYVGNNRISASEVPQLIAAIHGALSSTDAPQPKAALEQKPAVPVRRSINPDYIVCLEDGLHFKSMKRHLNVKYGLTPDAYRQKWGLPPDYPMVAPAYAAARSAMAVSLGLGKGTGRKRKAA